MRCISIRQPLAWAVVEGVKRVENRSRPTRHRGPLLIHASGTRSPIAGHDVPEAPPDKLLAYGAVVGIVEVVDFVPFTEALADNYYARGPWCYVLANAIPFAEPIPFRGNAWFFDVPDVVLARARFADT